MKYENGYSKDQGTCMPPEVYIRLMQTCQLEGNGPRYRSTVYPSTLKPSKPSLVVKKK